MQDVDYDTIEQTVYEAAVIPELWPQVLTSLGEYSNTAGAALFCMNESGVRFTSSPNLKAVFDRFVSDGWDSRNSRRGNVMAKGLTNLPRFVNEDDYLAPGEAETDPMINELLRPAGFGWAAGFVHELPHGDLAVLNLEQYWERGPIRGETLDRLDKLYPHLARAAMLAARSDLQRVKTAIETLEAIGIPAVAVSAAARVVLANDGFAQAGHVWTTAGGDRLAVHDRAAGRMLGDALSTIALAQGPRSIPIRAVIGGPATGVLQVVPVRRAAHDIFGTTAALVVLSEPKDANGDARLIQSLFDLTPAEINVAQSIAAGMTPAAIANSTGRSISTVRNQLRSVMEKTGSTRQVELVLLMQQLGRPVV